MVEPKLKTIYWTVTTECNQFCKHCWLEAGQKRENELNTEQWINIFKDIVDMGLEQVKVTGGEPLLHWSKIKPVLQFLADHEVWIRVESNSTLICSQFGKEIVQFLGEGLFPIAVSLDSHIPEHHDQFRGMKGAFEKTIKALKILKQENVPFSVVTVLHNENSSYIKKTIEFVDHKNPHHHQINPIMPQGRTQKNKNYRLPPVFYIEKLPHLVKKIKKEWGKKVTFNFPSVIAPLHIDFLACTVGKEICGLLPNGDIAVCGAGIKEKQLALGNAQKDNIEDIWENSPIFKILRQDAFDLKGICGNCMFATYCLGRCRAYAYSVYKELDAPYPICQTLYEKGIFPEQYMIEPDKECTMHKK